MLLNFFGAGVWRACDSDLYACMCSKLEVCMRTKLYRMQKKNSVCFGTSTFASCFTNCLQKLKI